MQIGGMRMIRNLTVPLVFQIIGKVGARGLSQQLPGAVIGMGLTAILVPLLVGGLLQ